MATAGGKRALSHGGHAAQRVWDTTTTTELTQPAACPATGGQQVRDGNPAAPHGTRPHTHAIPIVPVGTPAPGEGVPAGKEQAGPG